MEKIFDSFYFLHIPKTAGRFFTHNVVVPLDNIFKKTDVINHYDRDKYVAHRFWADFITENTYVVSLFRDPIKHAVSFYCHYTMLDKGAQRIIQVGALEYDKNTMLDWIDQYGEYTSNMQSKNFLLSDLGGKEYGFMNSEKVKNCLVTKQIVLDRLQNVALLLKSEQLAPNNIDKIHKKILHDFSIDDKVEEYKIQKASNYWNPDSTRIYKSLDKKDIEKILEWNAVDAEVYYSNSMFYDLGKA